METTDTVIYADIFLIINFCVDFTCIYLSASVLKLERKAFRLTAASFFGALYALSAFYFSNIIVHLAAAFLICVIAVKADIFTYLKFWFLFILTALLTGGLFTSLYIHASANGTVILAALPAAALISYIYGRLLKKRASVRTAKIKLSYKGAEVSVTGFVDSGNKLCDPVSGDNVVLVKSSALSSIPVPGDTDVGIWYIPMMTAAGSKVLRGFRPDIAEFKTFIGKPSVKRIIIAVDDSAGTYCGYNANIPSEIF